LDAEVQNIEAHLGQCGGCTGACQACSYDNDVEFELVLRVDQSLVGFIIGPFLGHGAFWNPAV